MNEKNRKVRIRPIEKEEPDLRRLARALIDLAISQHQEEKTSEDQPSGEEAA